ncbi:MAG: ATP-binding protein [Spongiibacteraceae bacterium]
MTKTLWWWVRVLLLFCWLLPAEAALPVPDDGVLLRSTDELRYLYDETDRLTLEDLRRADTPWHAVSSRAALPRGSMKPVWVHLRIAAPTRDQALVLYQPIARQIVLDVYLFEGDKQVASYETGNSRPYSSRPLPYRCFLFPIAMRAGQPVDMYIRVRGYPSRTIDFLQLWPERKLLTHLPGESSFEWANIGVMTVTTVAAILLWLLVRQSLTGLFALFVSTQLYGYIVSRGYGFEWLWPDWPAFDVASEPLIVSISLIVNVSFSIVFLDLKSHLPRLYKTVRWVLIGLFALPLAAPFWPIAVEGISVSMLLLMYLALLLISGYMFVTHRNRSDAGVFLLCSGAYIVFIAVVLLTSLLGSYVWWYPSHLIDFGQLLRTLLFAACLGYRFRKIVRSEEVARADASAKTEFLARMSHEIRTPMNGILGMSEMLRETRLDATQRRYNEIVYSSATSLLTIIDDILDFSKIQAGRLDVETVPFDLHQLATDALVLFRNKAESKQIALKLDIGADVPVWVSGDPTRLRQILINFLSNAVKFTKAGEIRLSLRKANSDSIRLSVHDTGPGIPADAQPFLFQAFMQADASIARQHGGTGLGLAISRQLTKLMGGSISVSSKEGVGSVFSVELPLMQTEPPQASATAVIALTEQPLNILVAEDNLTNQVVVEAMLERLGHRYTIVSSGAEAMAFYEMHHADIDLIFMDCEMPGMSGFEATRRIRAFELKYHLHPKPITALTAHALEEHIQQCRQAGMDDHLAKPLIIEALQQYLKRFTEMKLSMKPVRH